MRIRSLLALILTLTLITPAFADEQEASTMQIWTPEQQQQLSDRFSAIKPTQTYKSLTYDSPVMTQRFGADPYAMVYDGRVYLYMTGDVLEYDAQGQVQTNTYGRINTLNVVSSDDLINWTDHGSIVAAGTRGAAKWGGNSWAPAVCCKEIDGQMKFFIYFANGGNGIGVLTSDSPTGPFTDPLGHALISRSTPNCANVAWLFDPAVLVDDDGSAYLYFGGGIPSTRTPADPGTARAVKLGDDMISLDGDPVTLDVPFLFEDSGINRIGDTYYYSYCSNWQMTAADVKAMGFDNAQIVYMTSDSPLGPFTLAGAILKNPGTYFGCYGNNHHCIFQYQGEWYIAYHSQVLEGLMGLSGKGYRSTNIAKISVKEDGSIATIQTLNRYQLQQVGSFDPYRTVNAATMSTNGGISTKPAEEGVTCGDMVAYNIQPGDWIGLTGVDFGEGARTFTVTLRVPGGADGAIAIRPDRTNATPVGYVTWESGRTLETITVTTGLFGDLSGLHNLVLEFDGAGYEVVSWAFGK